jgi:hypothetical protein
MKLERGQKRCKNCKAINAARQRICTNCDKEFKLKKTPIKNEVVNWKELQPGDTFRIINGTGSYFTIQNDCGSGKKGEKIMMGEKGKFEVKEVVEDGIKAHGLPPYNFGSSFVYMGEDFFNEDLGIQRTAHRIVKINDIKTRH